MFETFLAQQKDKWVKASQAILDDIAKGYDMIWKEMVSELTSKKTILTNEIEKLESEKTSKLEDVSLLSTKILKLSDGIKLTEEKTKKYEARQKEVLDSVMAMEEREKSITLKEKELVDRENKLNERESALRVQIQIFEEKQNTLKRIMDRANQVKI